ncbi:MAG: NIPSNAP family protein [Ginsengibacter sp.]
MIAKNLVLVFAFLSFTASQANSEKRDFYQIKIYLLKNDDQVKLVDLYLQNTYLPALHRAGIKNIGVFKPIANDTAANKYIYVFIPFTSMVQWMKLPHALEKDAAYKQAAKSFISAGSAHPPYDRLESILLEAFSAQPLLLLPPAKNAERVFELRSYESPTENLQEKKIAMFNTGGEIPIFNRLGFNPVFYGRVLCGSRMPNFMYMPVFESMQQREAQWKKFGNDAAWKDISTRPENENNVSVSHIDSILFLSASYSDF